MTADEGDDRQEEDGQYDGGGGGMGRHGSGGEKMRISIIVAPRHVRCVHHF